MLELASCVCEEANLKKDAFFLSFFLKVRFVSSVISWNVSSINLSCTTTNFFCKESIIMKCKCSVI